MKGVWDPVPGKRQAVLSGHTDSVSSLSIAADGTTLASGSEDGTVRLWDAKRRRERRTFEIGLLASSSFVALHPTAR